MADVFISYKKEDFDRTRPVVMGLQATGFTVWWDDHLSPKEAWDAKIEEEISGAAAVVVLWTPRSVSSEWVRTEAHYGQDRGKLIPVIAEACTIPLAFLLRQTVDLSDWHGDQDDRQWRKLLTWIADIVGTKPGNANIPPALGAAQPNRFREVIGHLASGDPIVDGTLVNSSTPAGTAFRDGAQLPVMRILPRGSFLLGSPETDPDRTAVEGPQKRVEIPVPFAIGVFPIIMAEYEALLGLPILAAPRPSFGGLLRRGAPRTVVNFAADPSLPVTDVSFEDAGRFVVRLTEITGEPYRIPSEAEWEYACRAGSLSRYYCGDTIDASQAAFASDKGPARPGLCPPNAFGLYDMAGNVREWTADLWHESYDATPLDGRPATEGHGSMRVVRGGAWCDAAPLLRSGARMRATQSNRSNAIGFRVARALH
jgi:formylglycine-generating enzyme required for sulfatase activity